MDDVNNLGDHLNHPFPKLACPSGYTYHQTNRLCYKAYGLERDYSGARATCSSDGGTLAMPRDAVTNTILINLKNSVDNSAHFFFGLTDIRQEGRWVWEDGAALGGFRPWDQGEPDNRKGNQDCGEYISAKKKDTAARNKWNDGSCFERRKFICQVAPT
ncbi:PREDICTED: collectin-10-like [Branchiostoma belcheri]|uniref:Collectin-10-like n=1 Tax=Branchiostoma belcheri TaxID=7741 RepID=A0A6P4YAZ9_BRABE|nr:PREDICTED: collectin-10-like [Branchiostoma belcheri]